MPLQINSLGLNRVDLVPQASKRSLVKKTPGFRMTQMLLERIKASGPYSVSSVFVLL